MKKSTMIRARVTPALKDSVETIFGSLGLNPSQAITLFYKQVLLHRGLPFNVSLPNELTNQTIEASLRGEDLVVCENADDMCAKLGV